MGSAESLDAALLEQHLEALAEALPPGTTLTLIARPAEADKTGAEGVVRSNDDLEAAGRELRRVQRRARRQRERPRPHAPATSSFDPRRA